MDDEYEHLCLVRGTAEMSWMASAASVRRCSLPKDHEGQHIAYIEHNVTGRGANVYWLGPWEDGRPYETELTDRLQAEWGNRDA